MAHEPITMETSDADTLVTSLVVFTVSVDVTVVFGHFTLVLIWNRDYTNVKKKQYQVMLNVKSTPAYPDSG